MLKTLRSRGLSLLLLLQLCLLNNILITQATAQTFTKEEEAVLDRGGVTFDILGEPPHQEQTQEQTPQADNEDEATLLPQYPPALGTNFQANVPFRFKYIFVLGGDCDEPDGWLSKWVKAAMETLQTQNNHTDTHIENICSTHEKLYYEYSREFQLGALEQVVEKVGEEYLNQTLVIADQALKEDYTPVVELLRKGMGYFHGGGVPDDLSINLANYSLRPRDVFYLYFALDEEISAKEAGREVCRLKGNGQKELTIAKIYSDDAPISRMNTTIAAFREECPTTKLELAWEMEKQDYNKTNFTAYKTALRFNALPDIIFTLQDAVAADILGVAEEVLPPDEAQKITATGFDNNKKELMLEKKLLTSVDQMVFHPNRGLWQKVSTIVDLAQQNGINSTQMLQQHLRLPPNSTTVWSNTLATSSDQVGFLIDRLLKGYEAIIPPNLNVHVSTGLFDVSIIKMNAFEGKIQTIIWLNASWTDPRLTWSPFVYEGTVEIQTDQIWYPQLYFNNIYYQEELYKSAATVTPQGLVTLKFNYNAEFLCRTQEDIISFPFDNYECPIGLVAPTGVSLDQAYGFHVVEEDPHFSMTTATNDTIDHEGDSSDSSEDTAMNTEETVYYILYFDRRKFTAWVRLILPAVLINMIGFLTFWIAEMQETVALGVTSLLCVLTFRETVEMPDTADVTWTEVFMLVNVSYQAVVMLIIWLSYGDRSNISTRVDSFCRVFHPQKLAKDMVQAPQAAVKTHADVSDRLKKFSQSVRANRIPSMTALSQGLPASGMPANDRLLIEQELLNGSHNGLSQLQNGGSSGFQQTLDSSNGSNPLPEIPEEESEPDDSDLELEDIDIEIPPENEDIDIVVEPEIDVDSYTKALHAQQQAVPESASSMRLRKAVNNTRTAARRRSQNNGYRSSAMTVSTMDESDGSGAGAYPGVSIARDYFENEEEGGEDEGDKKKKKKGPRRTNVDWIGRWIVVPSYVLVMGTLLGHGWGY